MGIPLLIDLCLVAVVLVSVIISARRGAFKAVAGILGTVLGFIGASRLKEQAEPLVSAFITPFVRGAVESAAQNNGLESILQSSFSQEVAAMFQRLTDALGLSAQSAAQIQLEAAGDRILDAITAGLVRQMAPALAFLLLFAVIKLAVTVVCRLLSIENLPLISTVNKTGGALLGALSGIIIVACLCWGVLTFAPDDNVGIISKPNLRAGYIGGAVSRIFE